MRIVKFSINGEDETAAATHLVPSKQIEMTEYRRFIAGSTHVSRIINQSGKMAFG
jgi:hypothetical protein